MADVRIQDAAVATTISGTDKIPVSQGDNLPKTVTVNQILGMTPTVAGADGASAYEVAVANGFVGTEAAWLLSLVGADSTVPGPAGYSPVKNTDYFDGAAGRGIVSVLLTSGTVAPGTTDTYTITYTDATTSTYTVYNGADGVSVPGDGGVTDHGLLTGLADDDHAQYHTDARGDLRYSQLDHNHNLNDLTEKSYNSLTDKPTIPSVTGLLDETAHDLLDHSGLPGIPAAIGYTPENIASKDVSDGYSGLTLFKINIKNALGTVTNFFTTATTVARTWTMPDKDGTVAMTSDLTGLLSESTHDVLDHSDLPGVPAAYVHPTTDGSLHVPATSTVNLGKVLTAGATAGSAAWADPVGGGGSAYAFDKLSAQSVAFTKTAAGTASVKAGTQVMVATTLVTYAVDTAVTMPTHAIGTDYYIYACADGTCRADASASAPIGYTTANSRLIGGYHYGRIRNTLTVTDVAVEIVPRSMWDLAYRPANNDTRGLVDIYGNGKRWGMVYQASVDQAITLTNGIITAGTVKSAYNATPLTGTEGLNGYNFAELGVRSGFDLMSYQEWLVLAHGSPQGNDADNLNAWTKTTNTARNPTGLADRAVSFAGACDCVGNVHEWLGEFSNDHTTTAYAWQAPMSAQNVGQLYIPNAVGLRQQLAGGAWSDGVRAGARCLFANSSPWFVGTSTGCRFACDGL